MLLLITYDLHKPDRDYKAVSAEIQSADSCVHVEESVWIVDTACTPKIWRDRLQGVTDEATYIVIRLQENWSSWKVNTTVTDWLKSEERSW